jgi:hypothetical protein
MEPNFNRNKNNDDEKYTNPLAFKESKASDRQNRFLSLRKNKKMNMPIMKSGDEQIQEKYELKQDSFDSNNNIIQNFFNSQDKPTFLYQLLSSSNFNSQNSGDYDLNLIKFIIVQCLNYFKSEKDNEENLKKFFTDSIITNLTDIMCLFKKDVNIVFSIAILLRNLTRESDSITKLITLNSGNLQKIYDALENTNEHVASEILKLLYNCYFINEEAVNPNINIGVYVFNNLSNFVLNNNIEVIKNFFNSPYLGILISFLNLLINDNTKEIYKKFDSDNKNRIIYLLLVICRDALDDNLKYDAHKALKKLLDIITTPEELDVSKFGLVEVVSTFLPHLKLESNNPKIVLYSLNILDKFSYLSDTSQLIKLDLINQIEQILLTIIDINENIKNPKPYYKYYSKEIISKMLGSISYIISNAMADYEDENAKNAWKEFIINETRIIDYFVSCLKIMDFDEDDLITIYDFFKDYFDGTLEKEKFIKLILSNFLEIVLIENLKNNIINKNFEIIQAILELSLIMLQKAEKFSANQINFVKIYLEKKGFNEMLTNIEGMDFGNASNSEMARNIQEKFFK